MASTKKKEISFFLFPAPLGQICFVLVLISPNHKARNWYPEMVMAQTVIVHTWAINLNKRNEMPKLTVRTGKDFKRNVLYVWHQIEEKRFQVKKSFESRGRYSKIRHAKLTDDSAHIVHELYWRVRENRELIKILHMSKKIIFLMMPGRLQKRRVFFSCVF